MDNQKQETLTPEPLTQDQQDFAEFMIEECGLQDCADEKLNMMGQSGTVRYGIGRCAEHIGSLSTETVRAMILDLLEKQEQIS